MRLAWHAFTEVPGWPDAPMRVRFTRFLPILVPCLGLVAILAWRTQVHDGEVRDTRNRYASLLDLEQQIESLRLARSDQEAAALRENAQRAAQFFVQRPEDMRACLDEIAKQCGALGWIGSFQAFDAASEEEAGTDGLRFVPVVGKLTPAAGTPDRFLNLVRITELVFENSIRMDLTRLEASSDGSGNTSVGMGMRIGVRDGDEEAAQ
ncbi:MAG: hypothetical protein ACREIA_27235 [Opitutaceae bacterium]